MGEESQSEDPGWRNSLHEDVGLTDRAQAKSDIAEPGFTPSTASARTNPPTDISTPAATPATLVLGYPDRRVARGFLR